MIEIARAELSSTVSPERFVARWRDLATHPEWAAGMEYLRLDEPFAVGARGVLKVRGGHEAPFVVAEYVDGRLYADTTILDGAELTVHHSAVPSESGSALVLRAWLTGARAAEYADQMRDDVQRSLDADLAALARMLESENEATARGLE
ncbi:hypothetical protein [Microbacterium sp. B35-30]|uniref:hypothetical protein n=1 Tax=Microbacterium sp. B35-30 TaxID=1962642 RepID=UPI0013D44F9E|nr:hypothetical protein [Microbacterium sp. B35-30]KAF2417814.1 hypothetical protein B2K11_10510 [Microbacterium sp. B35-30]